MKKFRFLLLAIVITILGLQIKARLIEIKEFPDLIAQADLRFIGLAFGGLLLSYSADGLLSQTILRIVGYPLKFGQTIQIALLDVFAEQTLPLGGIGAVATCYFFYRKIGIPQNALVFLSTVWALLTSSSLVVLFLLSLPFLPYHAALNISLNYRITSIVLLSIGLMVGILALFVLTHPVGKTRFLKIKTAIGTLALKQIFTSNLEKVKDHPMLDGAAIAMALLYYLGQLTCLYASLKAFAVPISLPATVFSLMIALILGWISFIPGGIGIAESALSLVLLSFGYPVAGVIAGVLLFRVISFWIILPIGGLLYVKLEQQYGKIVQPIVTAP